MRRLYANFRMMLVVAILLGAGIFQIYAEGPVAGQQNQTGLSAAGETDPQAESYQQILDLKLKGTQFQQQNNFDSALHCYKQGLDLAESTGNKELISSLNYNISLVHFSQGDYETALDFALKALAMDQELNDSANIAASMNSVSLIYQEWGVYDKALDYQLKSIEISEATGNQLDIAYSHYNLGNIYLKTGKNSMALDYYLLARTEFRKLLMSVPGDPGLRQALSETVYSLGNLYLYEEEYDQALVNFQQALNTKQELSDTIGMGNCYNRIGITRLKREEYAAAEEAFSIAKKYKNQVKDKKGQALAFLHIGEVNLRQGEYLDAEEYFKSSIDIARVLDDKEILRENYHLLYLLYSEKQDFQEALNSFIRYKFNAEEVLSEETRKQVEELEVKYETDKKKKENKILAQDNKIQELTIQKQRSLGMYLIGIIVLVLSILVILYLQYRAKQRNNRIISEKNTLLEGQNLQIADQKRIIEVKNMDLVDSIRYAKRIQDSMLENVEKLNKVLPDSFILFRPKDIVSGDFYWFGQKGDKFIISAIDCTGHGVPGAFMSMLGNTYLHQIVNIKGICSPEKILENLSQAVQDGLKQSETNVQDGMDMALCTIDLKEKVLEYSGAKNPLVYIQNGELVRLKADRLPIGISYNEDTRFHKHRVELPSPTSFYMFSDGYPDQFGGEKGGKFMAKRLQKILLENHDKSMEKQKEILESTLDDWMKNEEQIDDILVIGFKLT